MIRSPGKLKHNLNINVQALLPGAAPPRRPALAKSQSLDLARQEVVPAHEVIAERNEESPVADGAAKDATKTVEVLQSVTKDRARIAVKRRPSTRKGREAIRKSCIDFTFDPTHEENDNSVERTDPIQVENQTPIVPELANRTEPTIVAPTDENEIKPVVGINAFAEKSKSTNLFSESDDDDDLFANVKSKPKMEPAVKKPDFLSVDEAKFDGARRTSFVKTDNFETPDMKSDLFDEDDDDKDIFSAKRLPPKSDFLNRNMFDDEDDDLFWSNSTTVTKTAKRTDLKAVEKKPKTTVAKKLENVEVLFDPLNAMKE